MRRVAGIVSRVALVILVLDVANIVWLGAESFSQGGNALSGFQRDGVCYVGSRGAYQAIDCEQWDWNRWHTISVIVTQPLIVLSLIALVFRVVFPLATGIRGGLAAQARADAIQASGAVLAQDRPAGRIGPYSKFGRGLMAVQVYPGGVVVAAGAMAPAGIQSSEIDRLSITQPRGWRTYLQIDHSSPDLRSPLLLLTAPETPLGQAIEQISHRDFSGATDSRPRRGSGAF